jgi:HAD superfamily hydrolase (TIGR01509 family)
MSESRPIALVVFDCDGVLIDSEVLASETAALVLAEAGVAITPAGVRERYTGSTQPALVADLARRHGEAVAAHFSAHFNPALGRRFETSLRAVPGIEDVLDALAMTRCVASSSSPERLAHSLALTGLHGHFAPHIYSAAQVQRGKPAPDLFLFVARTMGVEPARCLVIEDSIAGVQAGIAAGMRVVGFCGGGHCDAGHAARLAAAGAHEVAPDARALAALLGACGALRG